MAKIVPCYLGIDPGVTGGLALVRGGQAEAVPVKGLLLPHIVSWLRRSEACFAVVERPPPYIPGKPNFGSHIGAMTETLGVYLGILATLNIPFHESPPQEWQHFYGVRKSKGETETRWKARLVRRAADLVGEEYSLSPKEKLRVTKATGDALLLAHYCRKRNEL